MALITNNKADIAAVCVLLRCTDEGDAMGCTTCSDKQCQKCGGRGAYTAEIPWHDFIRELRNELEPPPDSTR